MMPRAPRWGGIQVAIALAILASVWRLQDLFPVVGAAKPVALTTALALLLAALNPPLLARLGNLVSFRPARFALAMAVLAAISVPWSLFPSMSLSVAIKDLLPALALMGLVAAAVRVPEDAFRFAAVEVAGAVIYSVIILTRFSVGSDGRLGNLVYYDANDLGMFLVCTMPFVALFLRPGCRPATRFAALGAIALLLLTIIKTGSRGAFLGLVAVVLYALFWYRAVPVRRRVGAAVAIAAVLVSAAGAKYWTSMATILHPTSDYNWIGHQDGGRMDIWQRGIGYMLDHPLTGVGVGAFPVAEGTLSPLAARQDWGVGVKWSAAHNSFVEAGAELGVGGLIAFVGLLLSGLIDARRSASRALAVGDDRAAALGDAIGASIAGYAVSGFFLSQAYAAFLFVLIGIELGLATSLAVQWRTLAAELAPTPMRAAALRRSAAGLVPLRDLR